MRIANADMALWLCPILVLAACEKPADSVARANSSQVGQSDSTTQLYNAGPHDHWDFAADVGDTTAYVAPSSYKILGDHQFAVAVKMAQKAATTDGEAYTIWVMEFDCARRTQKGTAYVRYNAADMPLGSATFQPSEQKENPAGEGTVGYALAEPFCKTLGLE